MKKKLILCVSLVFICLMLSMVSALAYKRDGNVVTNFDYYNLSNDGSFPSGNNLQPTGMTFHGNSGLYLRGWFVSGDGWGDITSAVLVMYENNTQIKTWPLNLWYSADEDTNMRIMASRDHGLNGTCTRRFEVRVSNFDALYFQGKLQAGHEYSFHIDVRTQAAAVRISGPAFSATKGGQDKSVFLTYSPKHVNSVTLKLNGVNYNASSNKHFNEVNKKIAVEGWATTTEGQIHKAQLVIFKDSKEIRRINLSVNMNPADADKVPGVTPGIMPQAGKGQNAVRVDTRANPYTWTSGEGTELIPGARYSIFVDFW